MSILNPTSDGNIEVLWSIAKFICNNGSTHFKKVKEKFVVEEPKHFENTVRRWEQLGVFERKDEKLCLSNNFDELTKLNFEQSFPKILRRQVFLERNNPESHFFSQESNLASDFTRMVAWIMLQKPAKFSLIFRNFDIMQSELFNQLDIVSSEKAEYINGTRYTELKRWCNLLGLVQGQSTHEFLDVTPALRSELDPIIAKISDKANLENGVKLFPARDFMEKLKIQLPVLDGGVYQNRIFSVSRKGMVRLPTRETASQIISLGLLRLEKGKLIKLHERADAIGITLEFGEGRTRKVDYIERLKNE